jgi:hypothetical protein
VRLDALQVERSRHLAACHNRNCHLGPREGQQLVRLVHGVDIGIAGHDRASAGCDLPDHAQAADTQPVSVRQELLARLAGAGAQHRIFALLVDDKI